MCEILIRLFVGNNTNYKDTATRKKFGNLSGCVGIIMNALLCFIKIAAGIISGGISLIADGLNNLSDMGSSLVTIIGFKMAAKPADRDHPYGHGRIEYMSALIVTVFIFAVGIEMLKASIQELIWGKNAAEYSIFSIIVLVFSILIKLWLYLFNRKLSKRINSEVLYATAKDSLNDCVASSAILISFIIARFIQLPFNIDAVMALLVSLFIIWSGIGSAKETINDILGRPPEKETVKEICDIILSFEGFLGIHDLIVHSYGPGRHFASVHVEVPINSDIAACHEQIDICEKLVCERTGVELVIHMDPIDCDNKVVNETKLKIAEKIKSIDKRITLHDFRMTPAGKLRTNLIFDIVLPADIISNSDEIIKQTSFLAKEINPTYCCVITVDNDYGEN
ncbi:MAG: cation transporter [Ruminococcaceae bacterium]|nr:cation transporter [Oscillospiraceae bacterium]